MKIPVMILVGVAVLKVHGTGNWKGPTELIWGDAECPNLGGRLGNLEECKEMCRRTIDCTAISFSPDHGCVLRKCGQPVPTPPWDYGYGYKGYYITTEGLLSVTTDNCMAGLEVIRGKDWNNGYHDKDDDHQDGVNFGRGKITDCHNRIKYAQVLWNGKTKAKHYRIGSHQSETGNAAFDLYYVEMSGPCFPPPCNKNGATGEVCNAGTCNCGAAPCAPGTKCNNGGCDCKDTPNWKDNVWRTCKIYEAYGYCKSGQFDTSDISEPGVPSGGRANKFPEDNCCICGKGSK